MFGSSVLEVAIGLTFCYGTVALIVATVQEALAAAFRLRANTLLAGIKSMLNDPRFEALAQAVYAHPLVNPHSDGSRVRAALRSPSSSSAASAIPSRASDAPPSTSHVAAAVISARTGGRRVARSAAVPSSTVPPTRTATCATPVHRRSAYLRRSRPAASCPNPATG